MKRYLFRRILSGILTVLVVLGINFIIIKAAPGDPIRTLMGPENDDPVLRAALTEKWGLDDPPLQQFAAYLNNAVHGDLGTSIIYNRSVNDMIWEKVGATVLLGFTASLLSLLIGTALGIVAAKREGSVMDVLSSNISYTLNAMPSFWLGLMLIILFATQLKLFPSYGMTNARADYQGFAYVLDVAHHMFLPALTLILISIPQYFRIAKSSVMQVSNEDFIVALRATGMPEKKIFNKYIFRNAILPTITIFGISMAYLITGVSLIEIVFAWPGMGRLVLTAITQRDYPTLQGIYLVMSVSVAVMTLVVDIVYTLFDPRIRFN